MTNDFEMYRGRRMGAMKKLLLASMAAAVITFPTLAQPASALPTGPGVRDGKNIAVFHNLDFVAAFGYEVGEQLTIDVYRGEHKIATAFGPAVEADEGLPLNGALEVNHGPEGAAVQGDCWENYTPDVLPGDRIVVTDSGGLTDEVLVDNITMSEPREDLTTEDPSDILVEGRASYADGTPIPIESLDSGELRVGSTYRATPNSVERTPETEDGYTATYKAPYEAFRNRLPNPNDQEAQKQAILTGDHAMGYGHTEPLPKETQLVEGVGGGGPAPGCEASPKQANAITISDDEIVNLNSGPLNLSGTAMEAVSAVGVTLSDTDPATEDVTVEAAGLTEGPGEKAWSAEFSREQLDGLADGELTATGSYTFSTGGETTGANKTIQKDTAAPTVNNDLAAGSYDGEQSASLSASEEGAKIHYTTDGSEPTAQSPVYEGPIRVANSQTIKALAIDKAGNQGEVSSSEYVIRQASAFDLSASSPAIAFGDSATLSGKLASNGEPAADQQVSLIKRAIGEDRFSPVEGEQLTTNAQGEFSTQINPEKNTIYRATFGGNDSGLNPSASAPVRVNVSAAINLNIGNNELNAGQRVAMGGIVSPNKAGSEVEVRIRQAGKIVARESVTLDENSRYRFVYSPPNPGNYVVRAVVRGDQENLGQISNVQKVKVNRP